MDKIIDVQVLDVECIFTMRNWCWIDGRCNGNKGKAVIPTDPAWNICMYTCVYYLCRWKINLLIYETADGLLVGLKSLSFGIWACAVSNYEVGNRNKFIFCLHARCPKWKRIGLVCMYVRCFRIDSSLICNEHALHSVRFNWLNEYWSALVIRLVLI